MVCRSLTGLSEMLLLPSRKCPRRVGNPRATHAPLGQRRYNYPGLFPDVGTACPAPPASSPPPSSSRCHSCWPVAAARTATGTSSATGVRSQHSRPMAPWWHGGPPTVAATQPAWSTPRHAARRQPEVFPRASPASSRHTGPTRRSSRTARWWCGAVWSTAAIFHAPSPRSPVIRCRRPPCRRECVR